MDSENVEPSEGRAPDNTPPKVLKNTEDSTQAFRKVVATAEASKRALEEVITGAGELSKWAKEAAEESMRVVKEASEESIRVSQEAISKAEEIGIAGREAAQVSIAASQRSVSGAEE